MKGVEVVPQGKRDYSNLEIVERFDAREQTYYWIGFRPTSGQPKRNSDLGATADGHISVTPLHLDLTEKRALKTLKAALT